jgi:hypothetical protein
MSCDRSTFRATNRTGISNQTDSGRRMRYFGLASMLDLMFDQLEYMLAHESRDGPARWEDCQRRQRVGGWQLLPSAYLNIRFINHLESSPSPSLLTNSPDESILGPRQSTWDL